MVPKEISRTDILSNKKFHRDELNRLVYVKKENKLYLDNEYLKQGRSIYFSKNQDSIESAISKKIFMKKLKSKNIYEEKSYEEIIELLKGGQYGKK